MKHSWRIFLLILVAFVAFIWLVKTPLTAFYLTKKMGVNVSIGSINLGSSKTNMKDFSINNPRGFKSKKALQVQDTKITYGLKNLFHDPAEIDLIELNNVFLNIELSNLTGSVNNWTAIGDSALESDTKGKEVIIHKLAIRNMTVDIKGLGLTKSSQTKVIPYMEFLEINSKHGFPTKELIRQIFGGAGLQQYIQDLLSPQKVLQKLLPFTLNEEAKSSE
jgi:hypothetical protein